MERIEKINELLEEYYDSEDSFEQTELAIQLIQGNLDWLINQAEMIEEMKKELIYAYQNRGEMYSAGEYEWIQNRIKELES